MPPLQRNPPDCYRYQAQSSPLIQFQKNTFDGQDFSTSHLTEGNAQCVPSALNNMKVGQPMSKEHHPSIPGSSVLANSGLHLLVGALTQGDHTEK